MTHWRFIGLACAFTIIAKLGGCAGSQPPPAGGVQDAVTLSRDACQRLLDATERPLPSPDAGEGGAR